MFVLLVLGAAFMVAHDRFYVALRKHSLSADLDKDDLQKAANIVGNVFAYSANFLLSAAIGLVFMQVFWMRMRSKEHTIAEIDAAMSSRTSPFGLGSLRAWRSMFLLTLIPALGVANVQIILLASGSMRVAFATTPSECRMLTVNLTNANLGVVAPDAGGVNLTYQNPEAQVKGYVTQIVMFNDALIPRILDSDFNVQSYPLRFDAPGLNCTDVTSSVNSSQLLPSSSLNNPIPVWNTVYHLGVAGSSLSFTTASRDLKLASDGETIIPDDDEQTVQCVFYNVTYDVLVNSTDSEFGDFESVVLNKTLNAPLIVGSTTGLVNGELNFDALADTFGRTLNGTAAYDPNIFDFTPDSPIIVYSPFGEAAAGIPWSLAEADMTIAIPALMDAVSLSLLSDILNTDPDSKPLSKTRGPCSVQVLAFEYDRTRLLVTYGVGILCTAVCIAVGCYAIRRNGFEESMDFSRILKSVVHPGLYEHKDNLQYDKTLLQADKGEAGEFGIKIIQSV